MPNYSTAWPMATTLLDIRAAQSDVVARAQLFALGVTRHHIRDEIRASRWQPAGPRAVVLHSGPLSDPQRMWVALINAGPRSALCGLTAAAADGLTGFETRTIHVMLPRGAVTPPAPGVVIHQSRRFRVSSDVHPGRLPPRTRLSRSLVDAACWQDSEVRGCAILAAAVQQGLVPVAHLRDELARSKRARRRGLFLAILGDIEGGADSFAEINAVELCRQAGLPLPARQVVRTDSAGRRRYLDLYWPEHNLSVEIDGGFHRRAEDWQRDMDRQNDLVVNGLRMLRFPSVTLRVTPDRYVDQVGRALGVG